MSIILFIKFIILRKKINIKLIIPVFFAAVISALVTTIMTKERLIEQQNIVITSVLFSIFYVFNSSNKPKMIGMGILYGTLTWIFQYNLINIYKSSNFNFEIIKCIILFCIPAIIAFIDYNFIEKKNWDDNGYNHNKAIWISIIIQGLMILYIITKNKSISYILEIISVLISAVLPLYVKMSFDRIKAIEDKKENSEKFINNMKLSQYIIYFILYLAVILRF